MKSITFLQEKGGVGKTTHAVTTAAGLAIKGARVLLVDTDPQGHATKSLRAKKLDGLLRLLAQDAPWKDVTVQIPAEVWSGEAYQPRGALYLMPSHINNRGLPMLLDGDFMRLRYALEDVANMVDVVVFDTSPTPSVTHGMVYLASDFIVFPTQCEYLSMDGLNSSTKNMDRGNKARQRMGLENINLLGVQPNMYDPRTNNHRTNLELMNEFFGSANVWTPLHMRTIWRYASQEAQSIFGYAKGHPAEREAWGMVNRIERGIS